MSVNQYRREVESYGKQRREAEVKANDCRAKESSKRTEAAKARQAAAKTTSASTARSKTSEAERREKDAASAGNEANRWQAKAASYAKNEASASDRLARAIAADEKKAARENQLRDRAEKSRVDRLEGRVVQVSATVDGLGQGLAGLVEVREPIEPADDSLNGQTWDVFLSHASEDKQDVAIPLHNALVALGVSVWLDKTEMRVGQSLRRKIQEGLLASRFSIVVLSESFFKKGWANLELDALITKSVHGDQQAILPIWHGITDAQVRQYSLPLADKFALSTETLGIDEIAAQIADVVLPAKDALIDSVAQGGTYRG